MYKSEGAFLKWQRNNKGGTKESAFEAGCNFILDEIEKDRNSLLLGDYSGLQGKTLTPDIAKKILAVRDELIKEDYQEAFHQLYSIASPGFDKYEPWAELESLSEAKPIRTVQVKRLGMGKLTEQFEKETGNKAMYREGMSDYHTLTYVKWLENKLQTPVGEGEKLKEKHYGADDHFNNLG